MKTLNLKYISFSVGDWLVHKELGYTAKITAFKGRTKTEVLIPHTADNERIWRGYTLPKTFIMNYIAKTFIKQPLTLF